MAGCTGPSDPQTRGPQDDKLEWSLAIVWDRYLAYLRAYKLHQLRSHVLWWLHREHWAVRNQFQGNRLPRRGVGRLVQDYSIRTVEKFLCRFLEVCGGGIEDCKIEIGAQEFQDAVGFNDHVARIFEAIAQSGHGLGKSSLLGSYPEDS